MYGSADEYKLSNDVTPAFQLIELKLDPALGEYSGKTVIDINLNKPSDSIQLYSKGLLIGLAILANEETKETLSVVGVNEYDIASLSS